MDTLRKIVFILAGVLVFVLIIFWFKSCGIEHSETPKSTNTKFIKNFDRIEDVPEVKKAKGNKVTKEEQETIKIPTFHFSFKCPKDYKVQDGSKVLYLRNKKTKTQISMLLYKDIFDLAALRNLTQPDIKNTTFLYFKDKNEYAVNYLSNGQKNVDKKTKHNFDYREEFGMKLLIDDPEKDEIGAEVNKDVTGIYTTIAGNGLTMFIASDTLSEDDRNKEIENIMDSILYIKESDCSNVTQPEMDTFRSEKLGITFPYPKGWDVSENEDGMISIKAPESLLSDYNGMVIEFFVDKKKKYAVVPANFTSNYEIKAMIPTFSQKVGDKDFDIQTEIKNMDASNMKNDQGYMEFTIYDEIVPINNAVRLSMGFGDGKITSTRWCFYYNKKPAMFNVIYFNDASLKLGRTMFDQIHGIKELEN